jgi:hypothetical protein
MAKQTWTARILQSASIWAIGSHFLFESVAAIVFLFKQRCN